MTKPDMDTAAHSALVLLFEADSIRRIPLREVNLSRPAEGIRWLHFSGDVDRSRDWLQHNSPLDSTQVEALCSPLTRPRLVVDSEQNLLLTLRTARTTDAAPLEFMSLRVWMGPRQLISVSLKPSDIISDFVSYLHHQRKSVVSTEQLLLELSHYASREFTEQVHLLEQLVSRLETEWEENERVEIDQLVVAKRRVSRINRHLRPQLSALEQTEQVVAERELPKAMKKRYRDGWREVTNRVRRDLEALAEMSERVRILSDTLDQASNERITRTMYLLSIVATFFLPLTFLTGLLGMNVAGIPLSERPWAFWFVCGLMMVIATFQWLMFRRWHWLR